MWIDVRLQSGSVCAGAPPSISHCWEKNIKKLIRHDTLKRSSGVGDWCKNSAEIRHSRVKLFLLRGKIYPTVDILHMTGVSAQKWMSNTTDIS